MTVVVGAASRAREGESVCGDVWVVATPPSRTLVCLADGLGHGAEARAAATAACDHVAAHADAPLEALLRGVDAAVRGSRGAAVSLLALEVEARRVRFVGIGNVELRAVAQAPVGPPTMPGIVGRGVRVARVWEYPLHEGDLFLLFTDGISSRFDVTKLGPGTPQAIADALLAAQRKPHDDAACVAVRLEAP